MAIKIIKQGKLPKSPVRFTCQLCGCVFDADGENLGFDLDESGYFIELVSRAGCPICGRRCEVRKWELDHE